MQNTLKVNEIFTSIQGEGLHTGQLVTFIRLQGCNLDCPWCDTKYALDKNKGQEMSIDAILKEIPTQFKHIVITGGEPFFQDISELITRLNAKKHYVQVETNGTLFNPICNKVDWLTVSPKPPTYMINDKIYQYIKEIKLVVDKEITKHVIEFCLTLHIPVTLQPEGNKKEFIDKAISFIRDINTPDLKLRLQQHKLMKVR